MDERNSDKGVQVSEADAMRQVLEQAVDAVVAIDEHNNVTFFNAAAERLWGYSASEVLGRNVALLVPPELRGGHDEMVHRNRRTGEDRIVGATREVEIHCKDGSLRWGSLSLSKVRVGDSLSYTAFVRDVTEERRIREGLMKEATSVMRAIAAGDLRQRITGDYGEAFAELKDAINESAQSLAGIVNEIRVSADTIEHKSREVLNGNDRLRERTEEQAASLEETSASMEEQTQTVASNAENCIEVATLATQAQGVARSGHEVVTQTVSAMADIREASRKVNDIVSVIDEIAFQTNLLALNAAVEAARAGDMGRGFAVVASEVRNLAQRSASAAKEIKGLISSNMERVEAGTQLVNDSGTSLDEIVQAIGKVSTIVSEIAKASGEQADGIKMINLTVTQMDKITQETACVAEGAVDLSGGLLSDVSGLRDLVSHFEAADAPVDGEVLNPAMRYRATA